MASAPAILEFELTADGHADAVVAARALIEWVAAIQAASKVIDPLGEVSVDLVSAEPACLRFRTLLNFVEVDVLGKASDALDDYPRIKKMIALNVLVLPGAVLGGVMVNVIHGGDDEIAEKNIEVASSPEVRRHVEAFYNVIQHDQSIQRVTVKETADGEAVITVDRSEFAARSGLWNQDDDVELHQERPAGGIWEIVVTHPVSIGKPLTWGFMRDGQPVRAKMMDEAVLAAIRAGSNPLPVQEGVTLRAKVSWTERFDGAVWVAQNGSHRIEKVLEPKF